MTSVMTSVMLGCNCF